MNATLGRWWRPMLVAMGVWVGAGDLRSAPPTLTYLFPAGGQRGAKVVVTCTGSFAWPVKVWAPGLDVVAMKDSGKFEVTIPKDLAADRVWIRLFNAEGASAAAPFLIDGLKEINEQEPNDSPASAQKLSDPQVTINGVLAKPGDVDCFAVPLKAGETLVAAVEANARLGSPMDAILQVTTADGHVLAENNDDVALDPRLTFTARKSGTYLVRIFAFSSEPGTDIRYAGAATFIYRLTLTTGPFITHAVPLAASRAAPGDVEVFGWNIPAKSKVSIVPYGGSKSAQHHEREVLNELRCPPDAALGYAFAPQFAGGARVRLASHPVAMELAETNAKAPLPLSVPTSVTGRLRLPRQSDDFLVPLKKGMQIVVSAEASTLDLPLDPMLQMTDPDGKVVATAIETGTTRDAAFALVAAKEGNYRLTVSDRYRQGGERCFYRLTIRPEQPDFELSANADAVVAAPGKPAEVTIKVQRRPTAAGKVGPITIQAVGLPPGVTAPPVISEATGPTAASVVLKLSVAGPAYSGPIQIAGKASQPQGIERLARTPPRLGASFETIWLTVVEKK